MTITCKIFKAMIFLVTVVLGFITRLLKKLNDILKFGYLAKPLFKKFSSLITRKMKFLFRIKRCNSDFRVKLVVSFLTALNTIEIFTQNGIVNRLEYGVQISSCYASSFYISTDKNITLKNLVNKYSLNKTVVKQIFFGKVECLLFAAFLFYQNCEENATEFVLCVF